MAIYQGNQGRGIVGGANAVFDSINQASQRYAEARQAKRNEEFISSLKGQGLLGVKANELIDPTTGNIKIKRPGKMRIEYNKPVSNLIISDGIKVALINKKSSSINLYSHSCIYTLT